MSQCKKQMHVLTILFFALYAQGLFPYLVGEALELCESFFSVCLLVFEIGMLFAQFSTKRHRKWSHAVGYFTIAFQNFYEYRTAVSESGGYTVYNSFMINFMKIYK